MVGQVQQGVALLRRGGIVDDQGIVLRQAVAHLHMQPAGVALLPRLRGAGKNHHIIDVLGTPLPQLPVKAPFAAVQVIFAVIGAKGIGLPVQLKARPGDAVGHPSDRPAEVGGRHVIGNGIAAQGDILHPPRPIRHADAVHRRTVIQEVDLHGIVVKQGKASHRLSLGRPPEKMLVNHYFSPFS